MIMALEVLWWGRPHDDTSLSPHDEAVLHYAAWRGCLPVVELLLSEGASVNAIDANTGETPLLLAAVSGPNARQGHHRAAGCRGRRQQTG